MRDVARSANVSRSAVSNYFNRPDLVSEASARRIAAAVERLGYIPNAAARNLRKGASHTLGLVLMDSTLPFFADFSRGVDDGATDHGWSVLVANANHQASRERQYFELFASWNVDGVIVFPTGDVTDSLEMLRSRGIGAVVVGSTSPHPDFDSVWIDDKLGGEIVGSHLVSTGCKSIAFVGDIRQDVVNARYEGLRSFTRQFTDVRVTLEEIPALDMANGVVAGQRLSQSVRSGKVDGVFACTDVVASGVLQAFLHDSIQVPEDVAVVGFDDSDHSAQLVVPLTTIRVPSRDIGRTSVQMLAEALAEPDREAACHQVFQPTLIRRQSTKSAVVRKVPPVQAVMAPQVEVAG